MKRKYIIKLVFFLIMGFVALSLFKPNIGLADIVTSGSGSYYDVYCPPNGECRYANDADKWMGIPLTSNIVLTAPTIKSSYKPGEKMTIDWRVYGIGTTTITAHEGWEIRYSIADISGNYGSATNSCLNEAVYNGVQECYYTRPGECTPPCFDQVHPTYLDGVLASRTNTYNSDLVYSFEPFSNRSVDISIPYSWSGKKVKIQIVEKFYQASSQSSASKYTQMHLQSFSGEMSFQKSDIPPLHIGEVKGNYVCTTIAGKQNSLYPNNLRESGLVTFDSNPWHGYFNGDYMIYVYRSTNGSGFNLAATYDRTCYGCTINDYFGLFLSNSATQNHDYFFDTSAAGSSALKWGDTIKYKVVINRWYNQSISGISNEFKFTPKCFVDKVEVSPTSSEFTNGKDPSEQSFTATTTYKSSYSIPEYCVGHDLNNPADSCNYRYSSYPEKIRNLTPPTEEVTNITNNNSLWSIINNTNIGTMINNTFKPATVSTKQKGKIGYTYNFVPTNLVTQMKDILNPGGGSYSTNPPYLQRVRGKSDIIINPGVNVNGGDDEVDLLKSSIFKGIFIGQEINLPNPNGRSMIIEYDANIVDNPPPGFSDLIAPNWGEKVP